ncbi:dsRNA-binding motif domain-containing protein [Ralstonia pseudosolanacearum]
MVAGNIRRGASPAGPMPATIRQAHAAISCRCEIGGQNYSDGPDRGISKKVSKQHF